LTTARAEASASPEETAEADQSQPAVSCKHGEVVYKEAVFLMVDIPFQAEAELRALEAKWKEDQRRWFVPAWTNLVPFAKWISAADRAKVGLSAPSENGQSEPAPTASGPGEVQTEVEQPKPNSSGSIQRITSDDFVILNVPRGTEALLVTSMGAIYEKTLQAWFVKPGTDLTPFLDWRVEATPEQKNHFARLAAKDVWGEKD
jgi:hypothetical protein